MQRSIISVFAILCLSFPTASGQSLGEARKRSIVRIETPEERMGTGFFLSDSILGFFLVTNKHVLKSEKTDQYFDSVHVRKNIFSSDGQVIATEEKATLYLSFRGQKLFREHEDPDVDLVFVPCGSMKLGDTIIVNPAYYSEWFHGFKTEMVADRHDMDRLRIRDGVKVQLIGFSFQTPQKPQFHMSRFGHIAFLTKEEMTMIFKRQRGDSVYLEPVSSEWIVIDITSRGGDSGSPVFALLPGKANPWLIGLVKGGSELNEVCFVHPSYYIWDLVNLVRGNKRK